MQRCLWYVIVRNLLSSEISHRPPVFERLTRPATCLQGSDVPGMHLLQMGGEVKHVGG